MKKKRLWSRAKLSLHKKENLILIIPIFLLITLYFFSIPQSLLFYDAPEHVEIIKSFGFLESLMAGHQPPHPVFLGFLWIMTRLLVLLFKVGFEYAANIIAYLSVIGSFCLLFLIVRKLGFERKKIFFSIFLFLLFPVVFFLGTGLLVESLMLLLFTLFIYSYLSLQKEKSKKFLFLFLFSGILLTGTHVMGIIWILTGVIFVNLLLGKNWKIRNISILFPFLLFILVFLGIYILISKSTDSGFFLKYYLTQNLSVLGVFRALRNSWLSYINSFGILTTILFFYLLVKNKKNSLLPLVLLTVLLVFGGSLWSGDLMIKRIAFSALFFAILLPKYLNKKVLFFLSLYLLPIFLGNLALYLKPKEEFPLGKLGKLHSSFYGGVLIETHYLRPFSQIFRGEFLWVGEENLGKVEGFLDNKKDVYLDSQSVTAPYFLYVGNNYHITSLNKNGEGETKELFEKYCLDLVSVEDANNNIFAYKVAKKELQTEKRIENLRKLLNSSTALVIGRASPGEKVLIYSTKSNECLRRERINYGDILAWIWVLVRREREPLGFTYADCSGFFVYPVSREELDFIKVEGKNVDSVQKLAS
jgi:hypothetical protein